MAEKITMPKTSSSDSAESPIQGENELMLAKASLSQLLHDTRVPVSVRNTLKTEYTKLSEMLTKLENRHLHIVVFGRVSVGKSSLLNALIGKELFSVSVLHGETRETQESRWKEREADGVFLIDTPGINEAHGELREQLALDAAQRADLLLFVVDSDITHTEMQALRSLLETGRPVLLVINKADQYTAAERDTLRHSVGRKLEGLIDEDCILFAAASPASQTVIRVDECGRETESQRARPVEVAELKSRVWDIVERDGLSLAALNASLFASNVSEQLGEKIIIARQQLGQETIHMYCAGKGIAVALNPLPVADLLAAAAIDVSMVIHLSRIYGLSMSKGEAGKLIKSIAGQMLALYSTFWAIHFASSALKISTAGLSTLVTGVAQGAVAWYGTLVVGEAAKCYLAKGKSWGNAGPKLVVKQILDELDKDSVIQNAKTEIRRVLKS